jgi:hypothetical protein
MGNICTFRFIKYKYASLRYYRGVVVSPVELGIENNCVGEGQQQFTLPGPTVSSVTSIRKGMANNSQIPSYRRR